MSQSLALLALLLAITLHPPAAKASECATSFAEVMSRHLNAIQQRDLVAYMSTIAPDDDLLMILPDGSSWDTRQAIEQGHQQWFSDTSWVFDAELVKQNVQSQFALTVYRVSVNRPERPGQPFLLSMLFAPAEDGCWYLRHDQNTLLPAPAPQPD